MSQGKPLFKKPVVSIGNLVTQPVKSFRMGPGLSEEGGRVVFGLEEDPLRTMTVEVALEMAAEILEAVELLREFEVRRATPLFPA